MLNSEINSCNKRLIFLLQNKLHGNFFSLKSAQTELQDVTEVLKECPF
jgi:hypothetical protein